MLNKQLLVRKNYYLTMYVVFLIGSFHTTQSTELFRDAQKIAQIPSYVASTIAQETSTLSTAVSARAEQVTHGLVDHATNKLETTATHVLAQSTVAASVLVKQAGQEGKHIVNRSGAFAWLLLPRLQQLLQYCKLSAFEGVRYCSKEYNQSLGSTVQATAAMIDNGKKATHQILEHAQESAKIVAGASIREAEMAGIRIIDHSQKVFDKSLDKTTKRVNQTINNSARNMNRTILISAAVTIGVFGAAKSMDNTNSLERSAFCLSVSGASFSFAYRLFNSVKTRKHPTIEKKSPRMQHPPAPNQNQREKSHDRVSDRTLTPNPFYSALYGDNSTLAARMFNKELQRNSRTLSTAPTLPILLVPGTTVTTINPTTHIATSTTTSTTFRT